MRQDGSTSAVGTFDPAPTSTESETEHLPRSRKTRRAVLAGVALLPALSGAAFAEGDTDGKAVRLARQLIARIATEYRLRTELEAAWSASQTLRRHLLAGNPDLHFEGARLRSLVEHSAQGRRHAGAYERWSEDRRKCLALAAEILEETVQSGPGLAAYALAYGYVENDAFANPKGEKLLQMAAAMLGKTLPVHIDGTTATPTA